jgi:hypothetical protein
MARLLIGLLAIAIAMWVLNWALAHYGVVLLVGAALCGWLVLRPGRHG